MKNVFLSLLILIINGCSVNNKIFVEQILPKYSHLENKYNLDNTIYKEERHFLFKYKRILNDSIINTNVEFIKVMITNNREPFTRFDKDYSQTVMRLEYLDQDGKIILTERTGLIENDKNVWLHPPRSGELEILQMAPFPYIKLSPLEKSWKWQLKASYKNYKNVELKYKYSKGEKIKKQTSIGELLVIPVTAEVKSSLGDYTSKFMFNAQYGFVFLDFENFDGTHDILELIEVN